MLLYGLEFDKGVVTEGIMSSFYAFTRLAEEIFASFSQMGQEVLSLFSKVLLKLPKIGSSKVRDIASRS